RTRHDLPVRSGQRKADDAPILRAHGRSLAVRRAPPRRRLPLRHDAVRRREGRGNAVPHPPPPAAPPRCYSVITSSTRRFCCRPAAVLFVATGCSSPWPTAVTRSVATPAPTR